MENTNPTIATNEEQLHLGTSEFHDAITAKRKKDIRDLTDEEFMTFQMRKLILNRIAEREESVEDYLQFVYVNEAEQHYLKVERVWDLETEKFVPNLPAVSTVYRWKKINDSVADLCRGPGGVGAKSKIVDWQVAVILEKLFMKWNCSSKDIYKCLQTYAAFTGYALHSYPALARVIRHLRLKGEGGIADLMSVFRQGRYFEVYRMSSKRIYEHSNQRWATDSTRLKIKAYHTVTGRVVNPHLLLTVDLHSGLPMGWTIVPAAPDSADNIRHLRECVLSKGAGAFWGGIPTTLQSDNGLIYKSQDFSAACEAMGIQLHKTHPYCPSENGKIERLNQTLKRQFSDQFVDYLVKTGKISERENQYVGTVESMQKHLDEWVIIYARTHVQRGAKDTILETWQTGLRDPETAVANSAKVEAACLITEPRTVHKEGVQIRGIMFTADGLQMLIRKNVDVRFNAVGVPTTVIARYNETDIVLKRNYESDQRLSKPAKKAVMLSSEALVEFSETLRETSGKMIPLVAASTAADMQLERAELHPDDIRKTKKRKKPKASAAETDFAAPTKPVPPSARKPVKRTKIIW